MKRDQRKKKLVIPPLQKRIIGTCTSFVAFALCLQFALQSLLQSETEGSAQDAALDALLWSLGIALPPVVFAALFLSSRIAGPIHRFETFLKAVSDGNQSEPCRIRKSDSFHTLCERINRATEPTRTEIRSQQAEKRDRDNNLAA